MGTVEASGETGGVAEERRSGGASDAVLVVSSLATSRNISLR